MEPMGGNPAALVAALRSGTFPRRDWDHRAHLVACWSIHREHPGADPRHGPLADRVADRLRSAAAAPVIAPVVDPVTGPSTDPLGEVVDPSAGPLAEVVDVVRALISAYNLRTAPAGAPPGCHETVTRYFVEAVGRLGADTVDALVAHPWCHVDAPARHWSRGLLWSDAARGRWVAPDLAPLPWAGVVHDHRPGPVTEPHPTA